MITIISTFEQTLSVDHNEFVKKMIVYYDENSNIQIGLITMITMMIMIADL